MCNIIIPRECKKTHIYTLCDRSPLHTCQRAFELAIVIVSKIVFSVWANVIRSSVIQVLMVLVESTVVAIVGSQIGCFLFK